VRKTGFKVLPFKRHLQRYTVVYKGKELLWLISKVSPDSAREIYAGLETTVGLCRLNQVDPYPITYSLSNP
jgi:hypothetical protein